MRISERFPDVSALGRVMGFDLGFRQLDEGDPLVPVNALFGENVTLTQIRFATGFHQLGSPPANLLTFGIPIVGLRDWFGREYRMSSILPFHHAGGIDGVSEKGFKAFTLSFSESYLADIASVFRIPVPNYLHCPAIESVIDRGEYNDRFRDLLKRIMTEPDSELGQEQEDELVIFLLEAAQNRFANTDRSSARLRTRAVERALAYIKEHQNELVSVRDICSENGIALRTLNRAFNERFGIGPKAYLKRQRLSAVRTDLLRSRTESLVIDVANRWGFWHMGQFAKDYSNLFGELPSQTAGK
ncbi:MAG: helix-turn-helix domain-containing protein [Xanthomonadales bacterium]|nr:helix-turn-helix domain-containing protein [Xanthomonadales bacterium]